MKLVFQNLKFLFYRLLLILILFSVTRIYFLFNNYLYFSNENFSEIIISILYGIRFDLSSIVVFNSLFIVLHLFPFSYIENKYFEILKKTLFVITNSILLFLNLIDSEYFKFTNKRTTYDIFSLITTGDDFNNLIPAFIKDYWLLVFIWIGLSAILWKFYYKKQNFFKIKLNFKIITLKIVISGLICGICFVFWRGIELRPISILSAAKYSNSHNIPLTLNTPFTIFRTINKKDLHEANYFPDSVNNKIFSPIHLNTNISKFKEKNVIIIILESFSNEYIGFLNNANVSYTPFLDSLLSKSLVFKNSFANGKKSMEAIPAITTSIPSLMNNPYITSNFATNKIQSLASCLKEKNYHTSFFHGGTNGTMGFDNFSKIADFDQYFGRKEFNNEKYYDGNWGIYDEEFLQFSVEKFNTFKEPFFSCIFTLTSHHPYQIPNRYKEKFQDGKLEIHKSIRYSDYSLQRFFEFASMQDWFENTIFVLTGDHTAQTEQYFYLTYVGRYCVPIAFYNPSDSLLIGVSDNLIQHLDIMPTVLSYLNYDKPYFSFGTNAFDNTKYHYAITFISGIYQIIDNNYSLYFDGEKSIALYDYKKNPSQNNNIIENEKSQALKMENHIKAFIQSYNNKLQENKTYFE